MACRVHSQIPPAVVDDLLRGVGQHVNKVGSVPRRRLLSVPRSGLTVRD